MRASSSHARPELLANWSAPEPAPLAAAVDLARQSGRPVLDLVTTNPHEHGLIFPADRLSACLSKAFPHTDVYAPDPLGHFAAREAIAQFYARRGTAISPAQIVLTPGTSQAYFYALRLLAEHGREVLIPRPGYPLFADLAEVAGSRLRRYHLKRDSLGWHPDLADIAFQCTPHTRAIVVVSPHNPTGCCFSAEDYRALGEICRRQQLALIVDEVFCECRDPATQPFVRPDPSDFPLVLTLNGGSKMLSLPGWKLGWMCVAGDPGRVAPLMAALERISDTFLPVPDLMQALLPLVLATGDGLDGHPGVITSLADAYAARRQAAQTALRAAGFTPDPCPAGVYHCVRLPPGSPPGHDEAFALAALRDLGVLVHPGVYYDLPEHWVMTSVAGPALLSEGIARLSELLA